MATNQWGWRRSPSIRQLDPNQQVMVKKPDEWYYWRLLWSIEPYSNCTHWRRRRLFYNVNIVGYERLPIHNGFAYLVFVDSPNLASALGVPWGWTPSLFLGETFFFFSAAYRTGINNVIQSSHLTDYTPVGVLTHRGSSLVGRSYGALSHPLCSALTPAIW